MTDRTRDDSHGDDDLDIQLTPVDDEFTTAPEEPFEIAPPVAPPPSPRGPKPLALPAEQALDRVPVRSGQVAPPNVERSPRPRSTLRLYFEAVLSTLVIWLFTVTFLLQPVQVPSGSMLNTILVGDHVLVNRSIFAEAPDLLPVLPTRSIRRGDVIVFRHPSEPESLYVKRVVGLPGETIEIYGSRVYIDGKSLPESRVFVQDPSVDTALTQVGESQQAEGGRYTVYYSQLRDASDEDGSELSTLASVDHGTFGVGKPFTIPDSQYFCMGDNRDNSEDSRFWGTVPRQNVIGRAMFVYWSYDGSTQTRAGFFGRIRWGRIGTLIQ